MRLYEADIVSAYRFDRTGEGYAGSSTRTIYNHLVRLLFGLRIRDINFAFKLCRRRVLDHDHAGQRGVVHRRRAGHPRHGAAARSSSSASTTSPAPVVSRRCRRPPVIVKILREMRAIRAELAALAPRRGGAVGPLPAESG